MLRRLIAVLCTADHRNTVIILERWLANKTSDNVASGISHLDNRVLVATDDEGTILDVGAITSAGETTLNDVSLDVHPQGTGQALLSNRKRGEALARLP